MKSGHHTVGAGAAWCGVGAFMAARLALVTGRVRAVIEHEQGASGAGDHKGPPRAPTDSDCQVLNT
jgi:hypothetical protein